MPLPSILEACRLDLFTDDVELMCKYPAGMADRIMRVRDMCNHWLANPSLKDRQLRDEIMKKYNVSQTAAYADILVIHQLVPLLSDKSRDFHRARANEMLLETYEIAKKKKDAKAMSAAANAYAKINKVDADDEMNLPYEDIVMQPFCASYDVSILGIKPIPDVYKRIATLSKELMRDISDISDVEYEEADLEENILFPPKAPQLDAPDESES